MTTGGAFNGRARTTAAVSDATITNARKTSSALNPFLPLGLLPLALLSPGAIFAKCGPEFSFGRTAVSDMVTFFPLPLHLIANDILRSECSVPMSRAERQG